MVKNLFQAYNILPTCTPDSCTLLLYEYMQVVLYYISDLFLCSTYVGIMCAQDFAPFFAKTLRNKQNFSCEKSLLSALEKNIQHEIELKDSCVRTINKTHNAKKCQYSQFQLFFFLQQIVRSRRKDTNLFFPKK